MKQTTVILKFLALAICLLLLLPSCGGVPEEQKVDVNAMVLDHVGDSYEWHIVSFGEKEIKLPLPVIVYSKQSGWHTFLSSRLGNGMEYEGLQIAQEGEYKGKIIEKNNENKSVRPFLDLSYTKNALGLTINCLVLLLIILPLARWYKRGTMLPAKGFKGAVEMLLIDIQDSVIKPCIGEDYKRFSPYLLTVFFFILINNVMGLLPFFPGGLNTTGNIAVTLVLAVCTFISVNVFGTREYWKEILWPEVPTWLKVPAPIMPVIELFGILTKPFALMIRLFANIFAGHAVGLGLMSLIFITASMGAAVNAGMSVVAILFSIFMTLLELLVAYIQAYVFTLLSAVFIGMSRVKHVKEEYKQG